MLVFRVLEYKLTQFYVYSVVCGSMVNVLEWIATPKFSRIITCRKDEGDVGEAVLQEEKLCDEGKQ